MKTQTTLISKQLRFQPRTFFFSFLIIHSKICELSPVNLILNFYLGSFTYFILCFARQTETLEQVTVYKMREKPPHEPNTSVLNLQLFWFVYTTVTDNPPKFWRRWVGFATWDADRTTVKLITISFRTSESITCLYVQFLIRRRCSLEFMIRSGSVDTAVNTSVFYSAAIYETIP